MGFSHHFNRQFFDNDFFNQFNSQFNDSVYNKNFGSRNPFLNNSPNDYLYQFPPDFGFTDPEELRQLLNEQLNHFYGQNYEFHEFGNQQQSAEWDKLMEQHQKDIEEFRKKWDKKNKDQ